MSHELRPLLQLFPCMEYLKVLNSSCRQHHCPSFISKHNTINLLCFLFLFLSIEPIKEWYCGKNYNSCINLKSSKNVDYVFYWETLGHLPIPFLLIAIEMDKHYEQQQQQQHPIETDTKLTQHRTKTYANYEPNPTSHFLDSAMASGMQILNTR